MENKILNGKLVSDKIMEELSNQISELSRENSPPNLTIISIGNYTPSLTYIRNKIKACEKIGIQTKVISLDENVSEIELIEVITNLNKNDEVDSYILQLPTPKHIDLNKIIDLIDPNKDVDGFHPTNFGKTAIGIDSLKPATPYGILKLIKHYKIETKGKHIVVLGRSNIVGKPLSFMLGNDFPIGRATVTTCDINTPETLLRKELKMADIVIVAIGVPRFLKGDMIKKDSIIIDVGINKVDNKIVGDVDFEDVFKKCSLITPVPGGVGPMTIAALISNILYCYKKKYKNKLNF